MVGPRQPDRLHLVLAPACALSMPRLETTLDPELADLARFCRTEARRDSCTRPSALNGVDQSVTIAEESSSHPAARNRPRSARAPIRPSSNVSPTLPNERSPACGIHLPIALRSQRRRLRLPELPTTTIGSFPQTHEVRKPPAPRSTTGEMPLEEYETFICRGRSSRRSSRVPGSDRARRPGPRRG